MVFVFDLDDTLCETDAFSEWFISEFFRQNNLPYQKIADVARFAEDKFSWDKQIAIDWYKEYGDAMFPLFPLKDGAKELLNYLHDAGHTIVISTARDTNWHADPLGGTMAWLTNNEIPYDKLYIGRNDKENICMEENADVFIDDDLGIVARVAESFGRRGHGNAFISTTQYNSQFAAPVGAKRVVDLEELLDFVKEIDIF